jgi:uridine kinase
MTDIADTVAAHILALQRPHPIRVGIDGRSAAGKTTFGDALAARLAASGRQVLRSNFDDFHPPGHGKRSAAGGYTIESYYAEGYDYDGFRERLLLPLGPGGDRRCALGLRKSATDTEMPAAVAMAAENAIVVVDGGFILREDLAPHWDFAIWLTVSFETMIERAAKRDVAWMPSEEAVRVRYRERWVPLHALYEATGARERAHMIIDNEDVAAPRILKAP